MSLGAHLITLREDRGVGRKELAQRTGLSLSYLHYVENDRTLPGVEKLETIADGLSLGARARRELRRQRELAELARLGIERPNLALLIKEHASQLSDADEAELGALIEKLAGRRRAGI